MRKLRLGLIGRPETYRGLGVQTQEFARHMDVGRILQVNFPTNTGPRAVPAFPIPPTLVDYDNIHHQLDLRTVTEFLTGLDVVFTAETPYDWRLLDIAAGMGVKTVIQGNPEFLRHGQKGYEHYAHPDAWWWPTTWRLDKLPPGEVVPVPMPDRPNTCAPPDARLRVLHVSGKRAFGDRNGTDLFVAALRYTKEPMDVTITSVDEDEPSLAIFPQQNLNVTTRPYGFPDRWMAYENQHVLVLPRRYGGLCLPALEAMASGLMVMMPIVSPNLDWPIFPLDLQRVEHFPLAAGAVDAAIVDPQELGRALDRLARDPGAAVDTGLVGRERTLWWNDGGRELYQDKLEDLVAS